ncbi:MAG TPA: glycosyltransferase family 2 protein [Candidatus Sulfotelmatobacter sp.]|nr:glycosyltransferase family 2 protein [Candidatus Sulfotelmatobacter sp.]
MATSKKDKPLLHIVTPVFNEGKSFPALYKAVKKNIKTPHELIVVYDFDGDNTVPVARQFAKNDKSIILHKNNIGRGALNAIKSGLDYVKQGPVLIIMADLSDDLSMVDKMYEEYLKGAAVVCGSRYMKGGKQIGGPFLKRSLSRLAGVSLHWVRRVPTHDITNNFKLYDKDFLNSITIESEGGFEVAMEITVKAFRKKLKIVELPTTWRDRTAGESNFKLWAWLPKYLHWYFYALGPSKN